MQTHCQAFYIQSIRKNTLNADLLIKPFAEKQFPCLFMSERNVEFLLHQCSMWQFLFLPQHQRACMSFPLKNWWEFEPFPGLEIPKLIVGLWFSLFVHEVYCSVGAMLFSQQNPPFIVWFDWCSLRTSHPIFCISSSLWHYLQNVSPKLVYQFYSEDFERQWNENTNAGKAAEMLHSYT